MFGRFRSSLQTFGARPEFEPYVAQVLRARQVRPSLSFLYRELRPTDGEPARMYRLTRASDIKVGLRPGTGDAVTLGEVFHNRDYEPPPVVARALSAPLNVLDLGANVGLFGAWAHHRWPGCTVRAYEPDPLNAEVLRQTVAANPVLADRWTVVEAAAGATNSEARFASGEVALSHLLDATEEATAGTIAVPVVDVLPELSKTDLLKMDIEGGEWAIWGDVRFPRVAPRVVVAEYHEHLCPQPGRARETASALLTAAGYTTVPIVHHEAHGAGMLWAYRS